ncbi:hypothetical protein K1719_022516 [Acacia pycnantha]|nr:hypothetical protein K1719_022516 [Acacia pycnantha]
MTSPAEEDEDEIIGMQVELSKGKSKRVKVKALIQCIMVARITGFLVGIFLIEMNFLLRKKVLYFVHGLKKSAQSFVRLGLVLVAWALLISPGGGEDVADEDMGLKVPCASFAETLQGINHEAVRGDEQRCDVLHADGSLSDDTLDSDKDDSEPLWTDIVKIGEKVGESQMGSSSEENIQKECKLNDHDVWKVVHRQNGRRKGGKERKAVDPRQPSGSRFEVLSSEKVVLGDVGKRSSLEEVAVPGIAGGSVCLEDLGKDMLVRFSQGKSIGLKKKQGKGKKVSGGNERGLGWSQLQRSEKEAEKEFLGRRMRRNCRVVPWGRDVIRRRIW